MSKFQTDALNPSSLPSASLGRPKSLLRRNDLNPDSSIPPGEQAKAELDKLHEDWNTRIDKEVKSVVNALSDLVELANFNPQDPTPHDPTLQTLHLTSKTSQLIRATQNIRDMAHELKLILVLSDQSGSVSRRDGEISLVRKEVQNRRREVGSEVVKLLNGNDHGDSAAARLRGEADRQGEADSSDTGSGTPTIRDTRSSPQEPLSEGYHLDFDHNTGLDALPTHGESPLAEDDEEMEEV